ncbi:MAG: hypothetical protein NDF54_01455 [archaeon GB-1867-035]|nr:hypothetical protein [Candidatus Culexmicrobium profundum]
MILVSGRISAFITLLILCGFILWYIMEARKGRVPKLRRLPALEAIDEAVGRATEMGRPVHVSCGSGGSIRDEWASQVLAGLSVLSYVAELCAEYDTSLIATTPVADNFPIMSEIVREAYRRKNKEESFKPDMVVYVPGYNAASIGIMVERNIAANIMVGPFWHESVILAEVGASLGAIQIGGTATTHQLPFIVASCDYVLIGEEMFAAGAYLSRDPVQIGSIAGMDWGKVLAILLTLFGLLMEAAGFSIIKYLNM